ncbi:MAG: hypothetical protein EHM57_00600 [Actinobacteria bacterium]|nr:MAG: hypothetical protein EHM57_00600 [Actinomycetota bacterium]
MKPRPTDADETAVEFLFGYLMGARMAGRAGALGVAAANMGEPTTAGKHLDLDERLDRLAVVVEAIWALLEQSGLSPDELEAKVAELEKRLIQSPMTAATPCTTCDALVPRGMDHCQFCGAPAANPTPFGGLVN